MKIGVAGSTGKMGRAIIACLEGKAIELPRDITPFIDTLDVLIDFTVPQASMTHLALCVAHQKAMVIGTTGFSFEQKAIIKKASETIPIVLAPNTSMAMNLCFMLIEKATEIMGLDADIEILEAHHAEKRDAPSGTALQIGDIIAKALKKSLSDIAVYDRRGEGPRESGSIGIVSLRARDIVGEHKVLFALPGESIEITHKASDRKAFAKGAITAAHWVMQQRPGFYEMRDVLGIS